MNREGPVIRARLARFLHIQNLRGKAHFKSVRIPSLKRILDNEVKLTLFYEITCNSDAKVYPCCQSRMHPKFGQKCQQQHSPLYAFTSSLRTHNCSEGRFFLDLLGWFVHYSYVLQFETVFRHSFREMLQQKSYSNGILNWELAIQPQYQIFVTRW